MTRPTAGGRGAFRTALNRLRGGRPPTVTAAVRPLAELYPQWSIGRHTYGWPDIHDFGGGDLRIGSFCSISDVRILLGGEHRPDWVTTYPFPALWPAAAHIEGHPASRGGVTIQNDVWIGSGAIILSGSEIRNGAVVGAGAVVRGVVDLYEIVVGNPSIVVGHRFEPTVIEQLMATHWWSWPDSEIETALPLLLSNDIAAFLRYALSSRGA